MYCYYKNVKRNKRRKQFICWFLIIVILLGGYWYYSKRIVKTINDYCAYTLDARVNTSVNNAIMLSLNQVNYDELVLVEKNTDGSIELLATNSYKVNYINREVIRTSQEFLNIDCEKGIDIPCGTFTGISLFTGYGKKFNYKILSVGSVTSNFISEFSGVAVNQTRHSIYIEIVSNINIVMPLKKQTVQTRTRILICEAVIVGKIPEVYLNSSIF